MNIKSSILYIVLLSIKLNTGIPSNSYYLIDIDTNFSINCSSKLIENNLYRIPNQCHNHLLCDPYHCDDKSFRCVKLRETLCCLYKYLQNTCRQEQILKDQFRSIYFHISIQHGYCEINLERIEQIDQSYCLANHFEFRSSRYRHHRTTPSTHNISSKSSHINKQCLLLLLFFCLIFIC
jgi:hypothetical protein